MSSSAAEEQCRRVAAAVRAPPPPSARRRQPVCCCSRLRRRRPPPQCPRARGQNQSYIHEPVLQSVQDLHDSVARSAGVRAGALMLPVRIPVVVSSRSDADRARVRLRQDEKQKRTSMFLLPRPRRDLPFVLAPMQRRLSPREMAPPRRRRRDQPRSSSERCRAATDMTVGDGVYMRLRVILGRGRMMKEKLERNAHFFVRVALHRPVERHSSRDRAWATKAGGGR